MMQIFTHIKMMSNTNKRIIIIFMLLLIKDKLSVYKIVYYIV